ncbi:MAG: stage 0 sporulation protein, partial [Clostridia bacterium]|nr:stage 0 sporulation protein [Clostridia bacterium]
KLIRAEYTFDNSKLLFYFSAEVRVDFRELVKDLASVFHTRIELRQIGIRDEAKMLGGLGVCGRPFCCSCFLSDFAQVSIKMAKEQNLSLNSAKISGACGRLMCCLRFEHETYEAEIAQTPPLDATVRTPDGVGNVTEIHPLTGFIKVKIGDDTKTYHRDAVTVLSTKASRRAEKQG